MNSLVSNVGNMQGGDQLQGTVRGSLQRASMPELDDEQRHFADAKNRPPANIRPVETATHRALAAEAPYDKSITVREKLKQSGLQRFLDMPGVTEVRVNQPGTVIIESADGWVPHKVPECDLRILKELANAASIFNGGVALDVLSPIKSIRLPDGQRGQIVIPPACQPDTVALTFRIPSSTRFSLLDYKNSGRLDIYRDVSVFKEVPEGVRLQDFELELLDAKNCRDITRFFELCIKYKLNICLSGGTGSGKTTFMKALADLVSANTCIITIEDNHELDLPLHWNKVHLFYGDYVTARAQIKSCMRMKPDRIFLTEVRGDEAYDYISALNTAHPGSLTSTHSNSPIEAYQRIATLIKQSEVGRSLDWNHILREVTSSIDVVAQFEHTRMTQLYYDPVRKAKIMRGDKDV